MYDGKGYFKGSGIYLGNGYVLTAAHNFRGGSSGRTPIYKTGTAQFVAIDTKSTYYWDYVAADFAKDIGLLKLKAIPKHTQGVRLAESNAKLGETVYAAGFARGYLGYRVNIVKGHSADNYQTIAYSNANGAPEKGDSGGPVFNKDGQLLSSLWGGVSNQKLLYYSANKQCRRFLLPWRNYLHYQQRENTTPKPPKNLTPIDSDSLNQSNSTESEKKSLQDSLRDVVKQIEANRKSEAKKHQQELAALNNRLNDKDQFPESGSSIDWIKIGQLGLMGAATVAGVGFPAWAIYALSGYRKIRKLRKTRGKHGFISEALAKVRNRKNNTKQIQEPAGGGSVGFPGSQIETERHNTDRISQPESRRDRIDGLAFERDEEEAREILQHARSEGRDSISDAIIGIFATDDWKEAKNKNSEMSDEKRMFLIEQKAEYLDRLNGIRPISPLQTT